MRRSQHHFGVFYQQDSRCATPWPAPSTSCVRACVRLCEHVCVWARVQPCLCACEHVETKWQTTNQSSGKTGSLLDSGEPKKKSACCCLSRQRFPEETLKSCLLCSRILEAKWAGFTSYSASPVEIKKKKERRRPAGLTAPFILYYPAWLLTPGELCSQIDALLLWGCSRNIKLYWNIHMWVHLAESNWCATPQTLNGNVAEPRHALADTLSYGRWDQAKASQSDPSGRPPVSESARVRKISDSVLRNWRVKYMKPSMFFIRFFYSFLTNPAQWWTLHCIWSVTIVSIQRKLHWFLHF